ncbi:MAG: hypothetical protein PV344_03820, partial [Anaplasma sp.]|nr:hypothetical protein [Anaplasma sp.]
SLILRLGDGGDTFEKAEANVSNPFKIFIYKRTNAYCKRLNFRENLIFVNCLRFAKNRSHEQFGQYVNATEATFASQKLEPANTFKFSALARFAKI